MKWQNNYVTLTATSKGGVGGGEREGGGHNFVYYSDYMHFLGLQKSLYNIGIPTIQLKRFHIHFNRVQNHFFDFIGGQNVDGIN